MEKTLRAILIDPTLRSITEVDYDGDYRAIGKLLGIDGPFDVRDIEGTKGEALYFDDEFLLKLTKDDISEDDGQPADFFVLNGVGSPIGGRGLILGVNRNGNSVSTKLTVGDVAPNVKFKKLRIKGWKPGYTDENYEHPAFGKITRIVGDQPVYEEVT